MATTVITLKVTEAELDLIDSAMHRAALKSRSETIRYAVTLLAERWGVPPNIILAAEDERAEHPPISRPGRNRSRAPKMNGEPQKRNKPSRP